MTDPLSKCIGDIEQLAQRGETDRAMALATELIERSPSEFKSWSLRAYLHGRTGDYAKAIADATQAIDLNSSETVLFFDRGRYELAIGRDHEAIMDFTTGLELCDQYKNDYYRETLYFMRAEALARVGRKKEALNDLSRVRDDFRTWTNKLRTKGDILADINLFR